MQKNFEFKDKYNISDLLEIMKILRAPGGCPWDIEQTNLSIKNSLLEETYEVMDAIEKCNDEGLQEELGDVMLQVVFHSEIATEENRFDFNDVCDGICKKMILRHPHVFGETTVKNSEDVLKNWDAIKKVEKSQETYTDTLKSVPKTFPALMRAQKVQKRANRAGFDWDDVSGAFNKVREETDELADAMNENSGVHIEEEFGDLLFAAVNVSRFLKIDPEEALTKATDKFISRFEKVENLAKSKNIKMDESSLEVLDALWDEAKKF